MSKIKKFLKSFNPNPKKDESGEFLPQEGKNPLKVEPPKPHVFEAPNARTHDFRNKGWGHNLYINRLNTESLNNAAYKAFETAYKKLDSELDQMFEDFDFEGGFVPDSMIRMGDQCYVYHCIWTEQDRE